MKNTYMALDIIEKLKANGCITNMERVILRRSILMPDYIWTSKVYLDSDGNLRSSDGCPTDIGKGEES